MSTFNARRVLIMIPTLVLISIVSLALIQFPQWDYLSRWVSLVQVTG